MANTETAYSHSQPRRRSSLVMMRNASNSSSRDKQRKLDIALELQAGLASKIRDRRWRDLKRYKQCFLHNDAISIIMEQQHVDEAEAVRLANDLVDLHYVSHVCNNHRFNVNESKTLYFRFHQDVLQADIQSSKSSNNQNGSKNVMYEYGEELEAMHTKLERLAAGSIETDRAVKEALGKIAMLEAIVVSLGSGMFVLLLIIFAMLFDTQSSRQQDVKFLVTCIAAIVLPIVFIGFNSNKSVWMSRISGNVEILKKLFETSGSLEDTMVSMTLDVEESDDDQQQLQRSPTKRRESLVAQVMRALSQPKLQQIQLRDASDLPDPSTWPHKPALLCTNTPVSPPVQKFGTGPCPIGVPFDFSTDLFEGKCLVRLRDVPSDDPDGDFVYFDGRKRRFQAIVQGRFKEEISVSEVMTGHEFRPLKRLPPAWLIRAGTSFIRRIAPGTDIVLNKRESRAMSLLAATSQAVSVDPVGNEPEITSSNIEEDVSLFGGLFASGNVSAYERKHHLAVPQNAAQYRFDTESVYTFDFYQNLLDVATYSLDLGSAKIGLTKFLDGQPIQVMAKLRDGRYLWSFQVWHENLLPTTTHSKDSS